MEAELVPVNQERRIFYSVKCPVCFKFVPPENIEYHLIICLIKSQLVTIKMSYSIKKVDVLFVCLKELQWKCYSSSILPMYIPKKL